MAATTEPAAYPRRTVLGMIACVSKVNVGVRLTEQSAPLNLSVSKAAARRLVRRARGKVTAWVDEVFGETELFIGAIGG
jgi:hypothetical protein